MGQTNNSVSAVRPLAALEWFVLKTVAEYSSHTRYHDKTLCAVFETVLGIRNAEELVNPICANLAKSGMISVSDGHTPLEDIKLYDIGRIALASETVSERIGDDGSE